MTGVFVLLRWVVGIVAAVWVFAAAKGSRKDPGGLEPDRDPAVSA